MAGLLAAAGCAVVTPPPDSLESSIGKTSAYDEGIAHVEANRFTEAFASFEQEVRSHPRNAKAIYYQGVAHEKMGDLRQAASCYTDAIRIDNEIEEARYSHDKKQIEKYKDAIQLGDELANAYIKRGNVFRGVGKLDEAVEDFTKAIEVESKVAAAYSGRGIAFLEKGLPKLAVEDLTEAIKLSPAYVEAYCERARAYTMISSWYEATSDCRQAIRLNPKSIEA
ncbi:MAG: tetratricopeptide repeat protein [Candidatus Nealsonbacteria bacterium]|nr:tetratricopeptide repeat protein [Candidatus Nealsonbacteria bacterium]